MINTNDTCNDAERRWRFRLPATYVQLAANGVLDRLRIEYMPDWLRCDQIATVELNEYWLLSFVPFAQNQAGDRLCWNKDWMGDIECEVVICIQGSDTGEGFAADFATAVARCILEDCAGIHEPDHEQWINTMVQNYEMVKSILPPRLRTIVLDTINRPLINADWRATIAYDELDELLTRELGFPRLREPVLFERRLSY